MKKIVSMLLILALVSAGIFLAGCSDDDDDEDPSDVTMTSGTDETTGTLQFYANGEDFVRQGFVSKDGWAINFDTVNITLENITAYQTDPPYDPHEGGDITGTTEVRLPGVHTIDLAEGPEDAPLILVGQVSDVETGRHNAISWTMGKAPSGPSASHSLQMIGTAEKDGDVKAFTINIDAVCSYNCGEYVGDERKGFVSDGGTAELEMTFHFDHLFGDADLPADDGLNQSALGFEYFLDYLDGQVVEIDMAELHLGHVGEGHCNCACE